MQVIKREGCWAVLPQGNGHASGLLAASAQVGVSSISAAFLPVCSCSIHIVIYLRLRRLRFPLPGTLFPGVRLRGPLRSVSRL